MNITDPQKEKLASEATKIFIQDTAWKNFPKMLGISNILGNNGDYIFKGPPELKIYTVFEVTIPFPFPSSSPIYYEQVEKLSKK